MGTGLQLVAERIDVSMDVPGGTQSFNLDQNTSKFQINNTAAPISGGADSKIILESRNSYLGGYRWKHDTVYQATPTLPGTYTLYQFVSDDQTGTPVFGFDTSGNVTINNNLTINGEIIGPSLSIPAVVVVEGTSQTFEYDGNHNAKFILKNTFAATVGNPSYVNLDFTNSTTGAYRFLHTSSSTDTAGLGTLKLQAVNSSGTTADAIVFSVSGGIPDAAFSGTATFNNTVLFQGNSAGAYVNLSTYAFTLNNINATGVTEYVIDYVIPYLKFGLNMSTTLAYIDSIAQPFQIRMGGTSYLHVSTSGNLGIGTTSPNAPLQFSNAFANRKIVLYEATNNDHQFNGFGTASSILRFQISDTSSSFNWYAATSSTASNNIMSLSGSGDLTLTATSSGLLKINSTGSISKGLFVQTSGATQFLATFSDSSSIGSVGTVTNYPLQFLINNTPVLTLNTSSNAVFAGGAQFAGYVGVGTTVPTLAKIYVLGGVANVTSEDSCIRITGSSNATKFEIQNTGASGKLYEITSKNDGSLNFVDRTAAATRFTIDTSGNATINGDLTLTTSAAGSFKINSAGSIGKGLIIQTNSVTQFLAIFSDSSLIGSVGTVTNYPLQFLVNNTPILTLNTSSNAILTGNLALGGASANSTLQFPSVTNYRKLTLYENTNNTYQYYGFGVTTNTLVYNIPATTAIHAFYAATSSSASQELMRITATGTTSNSGCVGINVGATPSAGCHVIGGVQNVSGEDTCFRAQSSTTAAKIEVNNTAASGRLYEIRSVSNGNFDIIDRTASVGRFIINTTGVGIFGSPDTTFSVTTGSADKPGGGSWGSFSDGRIKNIKGDYKHGLKEILQINPKIYQYTEESKLKEDDLQKDRIGIIAQEIEDILPECIELMEAKGFSDLRYYDSSPILYTLINAVKELNQRVEHLETTIH